MPRYLIERDAQGAGLMTPAERKAASRASCHALDKVGPRMRWEHRYMTDDGIHCVYRALAMEHSRRGGFPVHRISLVAEVIDPLTAE